MTTSDTLLQFPCDFPIKIIGDNSDIFAEEIIAILYKHFPDVEEQNIKKTPSKENKFLAISVTVLANDQKTLDALYMEVTKHPKVRMAL